MFKQNKENGNDAPQVNSKKEYNKLIREHETLKRQFQEMKRNYQSMSNFAHGEKADQYATKRMREEYEAVIAELKAENKTIKEDNSLKT